jgi:uncharacterized protein (DUF58 family)
MLDELTDVLQEVEYVLRMSVPGHLPGVHRGALPGTSGRFLGYTTLLHRMDLKHIDPVVTRRALSPVPLVRLHRSTVAVTVVALVDLSASMGFRGRVARMGEVARLCACLAYSAYRLGDRFMLVGYGEDVRLYMPPGRSPHGPLEVGQTLGRWTPEDRHVGGLKKALHLLPANPCLVFWISDFYMPEALLHHGLACVRRHDAIAVVLRDTFETEGPAHSGWTTLSDPETGLRRSLWLRPGLRDRWRAAVQRWDEAIRRACRRWDVDVLFVRDRLEVGQLVRFFLERRWLAWSSCSSSLRPR